jgi:triosephosphate isomerase
MHPLIAGNWKMHGTSLQLTEIAAIASAVRAIPPVADVLICPPSTLIARAARAAAGCIAIGGQDCSAAVSGAYTGDVSARMLKDAGGSWVIIGHSERRQHHGETDALVAAKAKAAWQAGLRTITCIGETQAQRSAGQALSICSSQLEGSIPEGMAAAHNAIAYEPLWAIGTGHTPTIAEIAEAHSHIRENLLARFGAPGREIRILYGGSVKPANAREFLSVPEVGGALVGGASLNADDFVAIIRAVPVQTVRAEHFAAPVA